MINKSLSRLTSCDFFPLTNDIRDYSSTFYILHVKLEKSGNHRLFWDNIILAISALTNIEVSSSWWKRDFQGVLNDTLFSIFNYNTIHKLQAGNPVPT